MSRAGKYTGKTQPHFQGVSFYNFSDFDAKMALSIYFNFYWSVKYNPDTFENGEFFLRFSRSSTRKWRFWCRFYRPLIVFVYMDENGGFEYGDVMHTVRDVILFPLF